MFRHLIPSFLIFCADVLLLLLSLLFGLLSFLLFGSHHLGVARETNNNINNEHNIGSQTIECLPKLALFKGQALVTTLVVSTLLLGQFLLFLLILLAGQIALISTWQAFLELKKGKLCLVSSKLLERNVIILTGHFRNFLQVFVFVLQFQATQSLDYCVSPLGENKEVQIAT